MTIQKRAIEQQFYIIVVPLLLSPLCMTQKKTATKISMCNLLGASGHQDFRWPFMRPFLLHSLFTVLLKGLNETWTTCSLLLYDAVFFLIFIFGKVVFFISFYLKFDTLGVCVLKVP